MILRFVNRAADTRRTQRGLSVVEALAALALMAFAFVPLLYLQARMTETAIAVERAEATVSIRNSAVAYVESINPMMVGRGTLDMGNATLTWVAVPETEVFPVRGVGGGTGRFSAQLFRIDVSVLFLDGRIDEFSILRMGWRANSPILLGGE